MIFAALAFAGVACDPAAESFMPGENVPGAFFSTSLPTAYEVTSSESAIDFTVMRTDASEAATATLTVTADDVFVIPSSVSFAAGQSTANVSVGFDFNKVVIDHTYTVSISIDSYATVYGRSDYSFTVLRPYVFEPIGTGYWVDNTVNTFFGVDDDCPMAVEIEMTQTNEGVRFRFPSPFARASEEYDGYGFLGYPYNDPEDCLPGTYTFVVDVTPEGVSLAPVELGMDWSYGMFSIGTVFGNLSTNPQYPLGEYYEDEGIVVFPPQSLFIKMADYGTAVCSGTSYLCLSAEALEALFE